MHGPPPSLPPHGPQPGHWPQPGVPFPTPGISTPSPGFPGGAPAPAEPVRLSRRLAAWVIDGLVVAALAAGIGMLTYTRLTEYVSSLGTQIAAAGAMEVVFSRGDLSGVAQAAGRSAWDGAVSIVIQGFVALVVLQLLYQFAMLVWTGRTLGKAALGLRVQAASDGHRPGLGRSLRRAAVTTVSESGLYSLACILLVMGQFLLSFVCWLAAVAMLALNGLAMFAGHGRRTLADRVGGTVVQRGTLLRTAVRAARDGAQAASSSARRLGRRFREGGPAAPPLVPPQPGPVQVQPGPAQFQQPAPPPPPGSPPHAS